MVAHTNFGKASRRLIGHKCNPAFALASVKHAFDIHEMFVDSWSQSSWRILPDINVSVTVIFLTVKPFMVRLTESSPQSVCLLFQDDDGWL